MRVEVQRSLFISVERYTAMSAPADHLPHADGRHVSAYRLSLSLTSSTVSVSCLIKRVLSRAVSGIIQQRLKDHDPSGPFSNGDRVGNVNAADGTVSYSSEIYLITCSLLTF